jgi:hypothetical protein
MSHAAPSQLSTTTVVQRPPTALYEVRTIHGEAYCAEGDVIEQGDGWFTLWADAGTVALRVPEADIRAVRHITDGELETATEAAPATEAVICCVCGVAPAVYWNYREQPFCGPCANGDPPTEGPRCSDVPGCDGRCCKPRDKDQEIRSANEVIERLSAELDEARMWARHGYEIGQRHCGWTDAGVAPAWLTEGWPRHFDSCEHLKQAADLDTALSRVLALSTEPEVMDTQEPDAGSYLHGYKVAIGDAKRAARPRRSEEPTSKEQQA